MMTNPATRLREVARSQAREMCTRVLAGGGITVGGAAPHDMIVHDERTFARVVRDRSLGLGEAYMDGWWDAPALDEFFDHFLRGGADRTLPGWVMLAGKVKARLFNLQGPRRAFLVGERHYDIGNDLYERMLDARMLYTCAYWKDVVAGDLDAAQEAKLDLVCRKIGLRPGMRVLDLGCGWGGFARFAAERGAVVTGYTVSKEQVAWGTRRCQGLPVTLHLDDYRNAHGQYDAVVSIGIMEHVGPKNYRAYMEVADRCLAPGGVAFVHTIAGNTSREYIDPWFDRYIFPNACLPSIAQLGQAMEGIFVLEDLHNIGEHYDATLMSWWHRFDAAWPELRKKNAAYDERFHRMWKYYLLACAGSFRSRYLQLYQLVMTRPGTRQPVCRKS